MNKKEKLKQLWMIDPKFNRNQASRDYDIPLRTMFRWVKKFKEEYKNNSQYGIDPNERLKDITKDVMTEEQLEKDFENLNINSTLNENGNTINANGKIKEEDFSQQKVIDLTVQKSGIDLNCWEIKDAKVGFHHTGMKPRVLKGFDKSSKPIYVHKVIRVTQWTCQIKLRPLRQPFLRDAIRELVDKFTPIDPVKLIHLPKKSDKYAALMEPVDIHFGKLAWGLETLAGNMDLNVACSVFVDSLISNLSECNLYPISKIFLIVGHDFLHAENYYNMTPKGHNVLDVDGRLPKIIQKAKESIIRVVDQCIQIAPVKIIRIPGNHDLHASYWLCEILRERYRKNKHVEVDNGPSSRKIITWGDLLIGFTHDASGAKQSPVVNMLPQFWPKEWGKSRWREWHTGHKHKKESTKFKPIYTLGSVIIRQIAALCTLDAWHYDELYSDAVPSCESFIIHKKDGVRSNITHNIDYQKFQ